MASSKRMNQIAGTIQREISNVLRKEGTYIYGDAFVTVTQVKMTSDLGIARVYLSIYNSHDKQRVVAAVMNNVKRLRQELSQRVKRHMRRVPLLEFYEDNTLDEMYRLREVFDDLNKDKKTTTEESNKEEGE